MFNLMDPATFWLNVTNIALGVGVLICCLLLAHGIWQDVAERLRSRSPVGAEKDTHTLMFPELGLTMADGGEEIKNNGGQRSEAGKSAVTK